MKFLNGGHGNLYRAQCKVITDEMDSQILNSARLKQRIKTMK